MVRSTDSSRDAARLDAFKISYDFGRGNRAIGAVRPARHDLYRAQGVRRHIDDRVKGDVDRAFGDGMDNASSRWVRRSYSTSRPAVKACTQFRPADLAA